MELHKHTLNLRKGDYALLGQFYEHTGLRPGHIIRHIISGHVDALKRGDIASEDLGIEIEL